MTNYTSKNRAKYLLQIHLIFSTKYRKQILTGDIGEDIKQKMQDISKSSRFQITAVEVDKDYIHLLISHEPNISVSQIVRKLKSESTIYICQKYKNYLQTKYWKSKQFWTPAYFVCSIGNANETTIKNYIANQG